MTGHHFLSPGGAKLTYLAGFYLTSLMSFHHVSFKLEEGRPLPSPSHLKRRIIIKNKKLKPEQEEGENCEVSFFF